MDLEKYVPLDTLNMYILRVGLPRNNRFEDHKMAQEIGGRTRPTSSAALFRLLYNCFLEIKKYTHVEYI